MDKLNDDAIYHELWENARHFSEQRFSLVQIFLIVVGVIFSIPLIGTQESVNTSIDYSVLIFIAIIFGIWGSYVTYKWNRRVIIYRYLAREFARARQLDESYFSTSYSKRNKEWLFEVGDARFVGYNP